MTCGTHENPDFEHFCFELASVSNYPRTYPLFRALSLAINLVTRRLWFSAPRR